MGRRWNGCPLRVKARVQPLRVVAWIQGSTIAHGYISATSTFRNDLNWPLQSGIRPRPPLASQAEGRGFEARRPLCSPSQTADALAISCGPPVAQTVSSSGRTLLVVVEHLLFVRFISRRRFCCSAVNGPSPTMMARRSSRKHRAPFRSSARTFSSTAATGRSTTPTQRVGTRQNSNWRTR